MSDNTGRIKKVIPYIALITLIALSVTAWRLYDGNVHQREENRFTHSVNHVTNEIVDRIHRYEMVLQGGAGLFAASEEVTRQEWQAYCEYQQTMELYPGVQGIGFANLVSAAELEAHVAAIINEGFADYAVRPVSDDQTYAVVKYIEPFDEENRQLFFGFNLLSDQSLRTAAERAGKSGSASISSMVSLIQEAGNSDQPSFFMFVPVYHNGFPSDVPGERQEALKGFIFAPFRMKELMENIFPDPFYAIDYEIYDGQDISEASLLYDSLVDEPGHQALFVSQSVLDIYGHQWTFIFKSTPFFERSPERFVSPGILLAGLLFSFLLFFYLRVLDNSVSKFRFLNQALQESEEKYRFIVEHSYDLIWIQGEDGKFTYLSPSWQPLLGYEAAELSDTAFHLLLHPAEINSYTKYMTDALEAGKALPEAQYQIKHADGSYRWHEGSIKPVFHNEGIFKYFVGVSRDITKRKIVEDEIRTLNEELEQRVTERTAEYEAVNKELESFAYSVSHDLRAPLRALNGFSEHLLESYADQLDDQGMTYLIRIRKAAIHMGRLIEDLLKLSRVTRSELKKSEVNLSRLVSDLLKDFQEAEPEREAQLRIVPNLVAKGDLQLLRIVLENLLGNAWKFSSDRQTTEIEFGVDERDCENVYFIRDNGVGFNMAYADKLFSPFQRLHRTDEFPGTGIGLATVQRIINRHGGRIWAESVEGRGAVFYFTLPG